MNDYKKVMLLREYISIAKRNGLAKNYAEFCEFIGKGSSSTLNNVLNSGNGSIDVWLGAAKTALEEAGLLSPTENEKNAKLRNLEKRVERLEDAVNQILIKMNEN